MLTEHNGPVDNWDKKGLLGRALLGNPLHSVIGPSYKSLKNIYTDFVDACNKCAMPKLIEQMKDVAEVLELALVQLAVAMCVKELLGESQMLKDHLAVFTEAGMKLPSNLQWRVDAVASKAAPAPKANAGSTS